MSVDSCRRGVRCEQGEQCTDTVLALGGVPEPACLVDGVLVAAADPGAGEVAAGLEVGDDHLNGSFGHAFAVLGLDVPLVVVLDHDRCGAVAAAIAAHDSGRAPTGHLRVVVERLSPEILRAQAEGITDPDAITRLHIASTAHRLLDDAPGLRGRVDAGRCAVVGLGYALAEGRVDRVVAHGPVTHGMSAP